MGVWHTGGRVADVSGRNRQSRWLLPSQILSNRCRLTLCLSTRAILYRALQLTQKAKRSSKNQGNSQESAGITPL